MPLATLQSCLAVAPRCECGYLKVSPTVFDWRIDTGKHSEVVEVVIHYILAMLQTQLLMNHSSVWLVSF